jgi:hypothetical protein
VAAEAVLRYISSLPVRWDVVQTRNAILGDDVKAWILVIVVGKTETVKAFIPIVQKVLYLFGAFDFVFATEIANSHARAPHFSRVSPAAFRLLSIVHQESSKLTSIFFPEGMQFGGHVSADLTKSGGTRPG